LERSTIEAFAAGDRNYKKQGGFPMTLTTILRVTTLAAIFTAGVTSASAQTGATDAQPGMMQPGMMGQDMMRVRGHMMKIMFAIADTDGDGALSFEEITAIHKRIFDKVDANKDGKVTSDEVQDFMRE
jgi:hypothetical protein